MSVRSVQSSTVLLLWMSYSFSILFLICAMGNFVLKHLRSYTVFGARFGRVVVRLDSAQRTHTGKSESTLPTVFGTEAQPGGASSLLRVAADGLWGLGLGFQGPGLGRPVRWHKKKRRGGVECEHYSPCTFFCFVCCVAIFTQEKFLHRKALSHMGSVFPHAPLRLD